MTRLRSTVPHAVPTSTRMALFGVAVLTGGAALWMTRGALTPVVDAVPCPGLLEFIAVMTASARPALAIATVLTYMHLVAIAAASALCALAVWRLTGMFLVSTAIGIVAASSLVMLPSLAPSSAAALAVAAATWSAVLGTAGSPLRRADSTKPSLLAVIAGMTAASAIAPSLGLPSALVLWWFARRRAGYLAAFAAAGGVVAAAVAVGLATPPLPGMSATTSVSCVIPMGANLTGAAHSAMDLFASVGVLTFALAALGLFAALCGLPRERAALAVKNERAMLAVGWTAASCLAALWPGVDPVRALAPVLTAVWLLAGYGLAETIARADPGWGRAATGGVLVAVFVVVNTGPRLHPPETAAAKPVPMGHEHLTRRSFRALLSQLPPDVQLVAEDAITDILLRSLRRSLHDARIAMQIVPRTNVAVAAARQSKRVFALPRAQADLSARGVQFVDGLMPAVPGVAEVAAVVPCDTAGDSWRAADSLRGAAMFAFVADTASTRGPIVLYAGSASPIEASPHDWPPLARRGFHARRYDRTGTNGRQALAAEVANDAAPQAHPAVSAAMVSRIELWRVPGAPLALMVQLSSAPAAIVMRQLPQAIGHLQVCAAFPFARHALAPPSGTSAYR